MPSIVIVLKSFLLRIVSLAIFPAVTAVLLEQKSVTWLHPDWLVILAGSLFINIFCFVVALMFFYKNPNDPKTTTFGLLAAISAHFIFYLFFIVFYYIFYEKADVLFVLTLMFFYILFLVFELVSLLNILRPLSDEPKKPF